MADSAGALRVPLDEKPFTNAVRETARRRGLDLLKLHDAREADLLECPRCGDRLILLDHADTYVFDKDMDARLCVACGAEMHVAALFDQIEDIGGEGG